MITTNHVSSMGVVIAVSIRLISSNGNQQASKRLLLLGRGLSLCPYEPEHRIVKTATKPMNFLEIIRRQLKRQEAVKQAQKTAATTLCYRGACYVK